MEEVEQVPAPPPSKENEPISAEIINASHATFVQDTKDSITVSQNVLKEVQFGEVTPIGRKIFWYYWRAL